VIVNYLRPGQRFKNLAKTSRRFVRTSRKRVSRLKHSISRKFDHLRYRHDPQDLNKIGSEVSSLSHLPHPHFIIIGAPKCGTSWMQRALGQHPEILMVPDEIEYFSMHLGYPVEWYVSHFSRATRHTKSLPRTSYVLGEKSARYCAIKLDRIAFVHRLLPNARLILMTRDPIARHWSQAKRFFSKRRFNRRQGGVFSVPRDELFDFFERMRPLGEFSRMIANWTEVYPKEQLLIVSQEKALQHPRKTYDAVLEHIGISRDYDPTKVKLLRAKTNIGPKVAMPDDIAAHLEAMYAAERERLRIILGDRPAVYARPNACSF
jgi:hypothetical protein